MDAMLATALVEEPGTQVPAPPREPKRWQHRTAGPTYGEWVRSTDPMQLTKAERRLLAAERAWEQEHPALVVALDLLVGETVQLVKERRTLAEDIEGHVPYTRGIPKFYPAGMRVRITARFGPFLQGRMGDGVPLLLRPEWVARVADLLGGQRHEQEQAERCEVQDPVVVDGMAEDRPEDRA